MNIPVAALSYFVSFVSTAVFAPPFSFAFAGRGRPKKYPEGYVIKEIRKRKEKEKPLDLHFIPQYLYHLACDRHGGWGTALRKAGLDPKEEKHKKEHINQVLKETGYVPEEVSITEQSVHWPEGIVVKILQRRVLEEEKSIKPKDLPVFVNGLIQARYDSWEDAVREAGFDPSHQRLRRI